ncbi:hypothetical protein ACJX0J_032577, partial [Zea mays]
MLVYTSVKERIFSCFMLPQIFNQTFTSDYQTIIQLHPCIHARVSKFSKPKICASDMKNINQQILSRHASLLIFFPILIQVLKGGIPVYKTFLQPLHTRPINMHNDISLYLLNDFSTA